MDDNVLQWVGNDYALYFWYGVVAVIVVGAIFRSLNGLARNLRYVSPSVLSLGPRVVANGLCRKRRAARRQVKSAPTKRSTTYILLAPARFLRSMTYFQLTPPLHRFWIKLPPLGTLMMLLAYLGFVLALEFIDDNVQGAQFLQARGIRAGWLSIAQMPLLILLVGKYNWIGLLTGFSYERLNVLHRWSSRVMLLMAVLHFGYQVSTTCCKVSRMPI